MLGCQLFVVADLYDFPFVQHYYLVGVANCGETVRHNNHRLPLVEVRKVFGDGSLVVGIKSISCLIQLDELRVLVNDSCYQDTLSLSLTDALSVLSYHCVVSQREGFDVVRYVCHTSGIADAFDVRIVIRYGDIPRNGIREEIALLHHGSALITPPTEIVLLQVGIAYLDVPI